MHSMMRKAKYVFQEPCMENEESSAMQQNMYYTQSHKSDIGKVEIKLGTINHKDAIQISEESSRCELVGQSLFRLLERSTEQVLL